MKNSIDTKEMQRRLDEMKKREDALHKPVKTDKEPQVYMRYTHLGLEFIVVFLGFLFLGKWLDEIAGTSPWLLLVCISAGFALGMYRIIKVANELSK
ncbi:MAG: AtpZ/AtpI family protein [Leptospiraceae bacterium]|nr:AtpZ/AtpI family protein [Leptospiraceae bacterium]